MRRAPPSGRTVIPANVMGGGGGAPPRPVLASARPGVRATSGEALEWPHGTHVMGDLRTFDGKMLDFHGNCHYVLARGRASRTDSFAVVIR